MRKRQAINNVNLNCIDHYYRKRDHPKTPTTSFVGEGGIKFIIHLLELYYDIQTVVMSLLKYCTMILG